MKTFYINEYDTDYHTWVRYIKKSFKSLEEAEKWCDENDGGGFTYSVDKELSK